MKRILLLSVVVLLALSATGFGRCQTIVWDSEDASEGPTCNGGVCDGHYRWYFWFGCQWDVGDCPGQECDWTPYYHAHVDYVNADYEGSCTGSDTSTCTLGSTTFGYWDFTCDCV